MNFDDFGWHVPERSEPPIPFVFGLVGGETIAIANFHPVICPSVPGRHTSKFWDGTVCEMLVVPWDGKLGIEWLKVEKPLIDADESVEVSGR